jgi:hypothetical protein
MQSPTPIAPSGPDLTRYANISQVSGDWGDPFQYGGVFLANDTEYGGQVLIAIIGTEAEDPEAEDLATIFICDVPEPEENILPLFQLTNNDHKILGCVFSHQGFSFNYPEGKFQNDSGDLFDLDMPQALITVSDTLGWEWVGGSDYAINYAWAKALLEKQSSSSSSEEE